MRTRLSAGFTLIEILVAVGIFALIGVVAARMLDNVLDAEARAALRAERLQTLQRGLQRFERDVLQYVDRGIRDELGERQPALRLEGGTRLELTRRGWRNPLGRSRSRLQRVAWGVGSEGGLERAFWPVLDRAQDSEPRRQVVLTEVTEVTLQIVDAEGQTWNFWPAETLLPDGRGAIQEAARPAPAAVELTLRMAPFGEIVRLIRLPDAPPELESGPHSRDASTPEETATTPRASGSAPGKQDAAEDSE